MRFLLLSALLVASPAAAQESGQFANVSPSPSASSPSASSASPGIGGLASASGLSVSAAQAAVASHYSAVASAKANTPTLSVSGLAGPAGEADTSGTTP